MRVAAVCMTSNYDKKSNIQVATQLIEDAVRCGADWICLPEMLSYHGPYEHLAEAAEFEDGPLNEHFAKLAKKHRVIICAGSVCEKVRNSPRVFNTQYVFDRHGSIVGKYRKIHLFNLFSTQGEKLYCESDGFLAGETLVTFFLDQYRVALATCYDLRFPEFFAALSRMGFDILVCPSAFTRQTGQFHWELLVRSRAVESLAYVIAPNQTGTHGPGRESFGHSMIVDPWGLVIANTGPSPGMALGAVEYTILKDARARLPALENKRIRAIL